MTEAERFLAARQTSEPAPPTPADRLPSRTTLAPSARTLPDARPPGSTDPSAGGQSPSCAADPSEPASVHVRAARSLFTVLRYLLAVAACAGLFYVYAIIADKAGWRQGGGRIPMMMLLGTCVGAWRLITRSR